MDSNDIPVPLPRNPNPENRYPEQRCPEGHHPENRYPEVRRPENLLSRMKAAEQIPVKAGAELPWRHDLHKFEFPSPGRDEVSVRHRFESCKGEFLPTRNIKSQNIFSHRWRIYACFGYDFITDIATRLLTTHGGPQHENSWIKLMFME